MVKSIFPCGHSALKAWNLLSLGETWCGTVTVPYPLCWIHGNTRIDGDKRAAKLRPFYETPRITTYRIFIPGSEENTRKGGTRCRSSYGQVSTFPSICIVWGSATAEQEQPTSDGGAPYRSLQHKIFSFLP